MGEVGKEKHCGRMLQCQGKVTKCWCAEECGVWGKIFTECHAIFRPISSLAMSRRVMPSLQNLYQPQHRHQSAKHVSLNK